MLSYWRKRRSATKSFNVVFIDGTSITLQLESRGTGNELIRKALESQRILSNQEMFGLTTLSDNYRKWLNLNKPVKKQLSGHSPYTVHLSVWAYPKDHTTLLQSTTRHQLYIQIKQDLLQGRLRLGNNSVAGSIIGLIVQREIGDFDGHSCGEGYVQELSILPTLSGSLERSVSSKHRSNRGLSQKHSEEGVLTLAQREFSYGTHNYTVQDAISRRSTLQLMICPSGIRVSESLSNTITYEWDMIDRVAHKGKQLYIDLNTKNNRSGGPTQFTCPSSSYSSQLSYWCNFLINYYCSGQQSGSRSRLRRFFSARRSMRRHPEQRRYSTATEERDSSFGNESIRSSFKTSSSPQPESNPGLVVYGSSGLASQELHFKTNGPSPIPEVEVENKIINEHSATVPVKQLTTLSTSPSTCRSDYKHEKKANQSSSEIFHGGSRYEQQISHDSLLKPTSHQAVQSNLHWSNGHSKSPQHGYSQTSHSNYTNELLLSSGSPTIINHHTQAEHSQHHSRKKNTSQERITSPDAHEINDSSQLFHNVLHKSKNIITQSSYKKVNGSLNEIGDSLQRFDNFSQKPDDSYRRVYNSSRKSDSLTNPAHRFHDSLQKSCASFERSHDSSWISHDSQSHDSTRRLRESPFPGSCDSYKISHDSLLRSQDKSRRSNDSLLTSRDQSRRSHDSVHKSYDSPRRSHDLLQHSHNSPQRLRGSRPSSNDGFKHYELGPQRRSSRESSPFIEDGRYPRGGSLTRNVVPDYPLKEDAVVVGGGQNTSSRESKRVIDPAAKPKNRTRLSLPDPDNYYESQGKRGSRLSMSSRRARNTSIVSTTYLSQPLENGHWGANSKLGSIASLEAQASLAELSQADSFVDPHMRSFVFMASQPDTATEL